MVDYSRAATSKAAKASFDKAAQSLISEIQALQAEYETEWKKVEELRKSRASLIENVIPILKHSDIRLQRPLSKCDNTELIEELRGTVNSLDTTPQEEVKVAMVRIESRYGQLVNQAKKLDALYERLSSYYVPEKDYGDEVVVSLKGKKKKKDKSNEESDESLAVKMVQVQEDHKEQSIAMEDDTIELDVSETPLFEATTLGDFPQIEIGEPLPEDEYASLEMPEDDMEEFSVDDFSSIFQGMENAEEVPEDLIQVVSVAPASQSLIEDVEALLDSKKLTGFLDKIGESTEEDEIAPLDEVVAVKENIEESEPDYHIYSLDQGQTLAQIVEYVYEGNLTWYDLYRYADNADAIDTRCEKMRINIEDAANTPGMLTGLELKYPKNYLSYEDVEVGYGKAA